MWAPRAFHASWDGKTIISHSFDGFRVTRGAETRDYKIQLLHRNIFWSPDCKKFVYWLPEGIALSDVEDLGPPGGAPKSKVIYPTPTGRYPFGVTWSPSGTAIYVIEHFEDGAQESGTSIKRVPLTGGAATEILHHPVEVSFFMPPDSWYEDGSGPKDRPYSIVFGAKDGLYLLERDGSSKTKIADIPPDGVGDVIWNPSGKEELLVVFKTPAKSASGKVLRGVYLVRARAKKDEVLEQLTPDLDVHTLWFSKHGKYVCWATPAGVFLRLADAKEPAKKITIADAPAEVKGCAWDDAEKRLLIAAGNRLYVYDVATGSATLLAKVGDDAKTFIAEPSWHGDEVVFSTFTNTAAKRRRSP